MDSGSAAFEFVVQRPNERLSRETRSKIRRHAMKAVGAARRKPNEMASKHHTTGYDLDALDDLTAMPLSGLELMVRDYGLDPMDMSALTSVHRGNWASSILHSGPQHLRDILRCRQWSYFSYIPPRFGQVAALDDAFRCLITVAHTMLVPAYKQTDAKILGYYGKALRSLQAAVNDSRARYKAEILCAAGVLALFELLNSPDGQSWGPHIAGVSHLIQLRGPNRFTSEFDRALLFALAYPLVTEALLSNQECILGHPSWDDAFKDSTVPGETFTDRSPQGIALLMLMVKLPGVVKRATHGIMSQDTIATEFIEATITDLRALRSSAIAWRRDFNTALLCTAHSNHAFDAGPGKDTSHNDFGKRYELLAVLLVFHIHVSRFLVCLVPKDRALLEEEVQNLATELKTVQGSVVHDHRVSLLLAQKAKTADAVMATQAEFQDLSGKENIVEPWRFRRFCDVIGRKYCDGQTCCSLDVQ